MFDSFCFPIVMQTGSVIKLKNFYQSDRWVKISQRSFNLHFSKKEWSQTSFNVLNMFKSQLSICVCVVCVNICSSVLSIFVLKVFCFFACLFCFVPLDSSEIFNYRNNGPFICDISANIFYQFDGYIFILLIFFHVKGFLLHVFKCINIFFYAHAL